MPASPSENRTRWRKRKRDSQISRRHQKHEEEEEDDEENPNAAEEDHAERDYDSEDQTHHNHPNSQPHVEAEVLSDHGVQISQFPAVIKRSVNRPHSSVTAIVALERALESGDNKAQSALDAPILENVSHGQLQALSSVPSDNFALDCDSSFVITPPPILEGRGVVKRFGTKVLVVPMHSDWFSPATVHRLERQVVPHFFSGKSPDHTPEKYMECRNCIVALHMEDPGMRITVSDCQGLLAGVNVEDLTRIVRFLDHWGIINYCVRIPSHESPNAVSCLRDEPSGEVRVPSEALKSIDSLIKFDKPNCKLKADEIYSSLTAHSADVLDLEDRIREHLSENHCNYCSCPLPVVYYQSQKEVDILLCTDCFHDGRFVIGHSSIDFVRVDSTRDYGELDGDNWTDQETLLLLEAMEIYNENWNEIAEHVGTKSKAQCILHFLRLPMEDGKLENINVPSLSLSSNAINRDDSGRLHCYSNGVTAGPVYQTRDSDHRLPFANSGNPVMALVAFLASAVGPRVAASCAHAALAVLSEDNSGSTSQLEAPGHDNRTNSESIHCRDGGPHQETAVSNHNEDKAKVHGSWGIYEGRTTPLSAEKVKDAAKAGLSAAAMKAKLFSDHEEREIQRLCANIVNHQLKRLELKLKQFAEIETLLMKECEQLERTKQRIAADRSRMMSARLGTVGATPTMNASGVGTSMASNGNNRQQIISASSSQPSISGYGNNQPVHPHMSFAPRPSMFGLGQRLPLSMIQQSQSASSTAMFNAPSNVQPTTNHPLLRPVSGTNSGLG
ncbi:SWI/SNF complex subunit SWI3C-like isoform X1 [Glycine soja]|uniref:SWI/SNF complex subunit SWI3C isoform A n=1 Tax=Glycine soja TaxID=3848 RepID=A0A445K865_GLYSO|nr:SWI/SNF complex subunit SWI3C-like isoform X1 [Glycine soja]RZC06980.1 SWI/SNF complex subunit SWI3C isoform A [Glycine soja]